MEIVYFSMLYLVAYRFAYIIEKFIGLSNNGYRVCFWKMFLNRLFLFLRKIYNVLLILIYPTVIFINGKKAKNGYMLCWLKMNKNISAHVKRSN